MKAVIKTGGKQYLVEIGQKLQIEKIEKEEGQKVIFDKVLLVEKEGKVKIGTPFVKGAKVIGKVLKQGKGEKIIILKHKRRKRYRVKKGHRQPFTEIEILKIEL